MVTQINSSPIGSASTAQIADLATRAKPLAHELARDDGPAAIDSTDARGALSSIQQGLANATTALDVALKLGRSALADLASGGDRTPDQLAAFADQLRKADAASGGLLTGGSLTVRTSLDGGAVEIDGIDLRAIGADAASVKDLGEALNRFSSAADKIASHARFAAVTQSGVNGVNADLDSEQARLSALDAAQSLRGASQSIANATPVSLLSLFRA